MDTCLVILRTKDDVLPQLQVSRIRMPGGVVASWKLYRLGDVLLRKKSTRCCHFLSSDQVSLAMLVQWYYYTSLIRAGDSVLTTSNSISIPSRKGIHCQHKPVSVRDER
eukprot:NODE_888_length_3426_cov_0.568380.p1 type:complete len:109 gc:universal NODE_888_length_3426_cov_0.568380:1805-2131(+)